MSKIGGYALVFVLLLSSVDLQAAPPPDRNVDAALCESAPDIDGSLGDPCWTSAAVLDGFVQTRPGDNTPPSRETRVLIAYDERALYVAVKATDDPSLVRATVARRDAVLSDDYVQLHLDTFHDRRRAYVLVFNPLGVQQDGVFVEGRDPDYSVDLVMESKGQLTADGYVIEIAIPFSSLRHRGGARAVWGLHVQRRIQHLDEDDSWMPLVRGKSALLSQAGSITGFEAIDGRRTLDVIPNVTASADGRRVRRFPPGSGHADTGRFDTQPITTDPGVTMKLALTPDIALDATVNPDFAQIESDQLVSTANQRFPTFFEEKRPFFLEGLDLFQTPLQAVHSRTIIDPDYAAKASGRSGRTGFGVLVARDNAPGDFSDEELNDPAKRPAIEPFIGRNATAAIVRLRRDVGTAESYLGLLATSYDFVQKQNRVIGVDGRLSVDPRTTLSFQLLGTWSKRDFYDPDTNEDVHRRGQGFGFFVEWLRTGRHFNVTLSGEGRTPDYRADLGFTTQTDTNRWSIVTRYDSEPRPEARLISWTFTHTLYSQWDWEGRVKYAYVYPRLRLNFRRQTHATLYLYSDYLRLLEEEFGPRRSSTQAGAFYGEPERSSIYRGVTLEIGTTPWKRVSASLTIDRTWDTFDYDFGAPPRYSRVSPAALVDPDAPLDPGEGRSLNVTTRLELQPTDMLRLTFDAACNRMVRDDTGLVAFDERLYSVQGTQFFTANAFARLRVDYESLRSNVRGQLLVGWTPGPGTAVYVGYSDDLTHDGFSPFTGEREPGLHRNRRTVFAKMSYLLRRPL